MKLYRVASRCQTRPCFERRPILFKFSSRTPHKCCVVHTNRSNVALCLLPHSVKNVLIQSILSSHCYAAALLTKEACRYISRVCAQLFLPALVIFSTGSALSPAALLDAWPLMVAGGFTTSLSTVLAGFMARLLLQSDDRRAFRPVRVAIAMPNALGFPLLLMASLCEQDDVNR